MTSHCLTVILSHASHVKTWTSAAFAHRTKIQLSLTAACWAESQTGPVYCHADTQTKTRSGCDPDFEAVSAFFFLSLNVARKKRRLLQEDVTWLTTFTVSNKTATARHTRLWISNWFVFYFTPVRNCHPVKRNADQSASATRRVRDISAAGGVSDTEINRALTRTPGCHTVWIFSFLHDRQRVIITGWVTCLR